MSVRTAAMGRLVGLTAIALVAVSPAAYSAAGSTPDARPADGASAFAGPVTARPRALDVDLSTSGGTLRPVRCTATTPGTRCWVSLSLK